MEQKMKRETEPKTREVTRARATFQYYIENAYLENIKKQVKKK